jgi:hypothetical protein
VWFRVFFGWGVLSEEDCLFFVRDKAILAALCTDGRTMATAHELGLSVRLGRVGKTEPAWHT